MSLGHTLTRPKKNILWQWHLYPNPFHLCFTIGQRNVSTPPLLLSCGHYVTMSNHTETTTIYFLFLPKPINNFHLLTRPTPLLPKKKKKNMRESKGMARKRYLWSTTDSNILDFIIKFFPTKKKNPNDILRVLD